MKCKNVVMYKNNVYPLCKPIDYDTEIINMDATLHLWANCFDVSELAPEKYMSKIVEFCAWSITLNYSYEINNNTVEVFVQG